MIPDGPAGRQLSWYLDRLVTAGNGASAADFERFAPALRPTTVAAITDEDVHHNWSTTSLRLGPFEIASVDATSDFAIVVTLNGVDGKRWNVSCQVEEEEPHLICGINIERIFDFEVTVREATEDDAAALAEIERRCPIVLGDKSATFDRGEDYFAFARLMEDVTVAIGFVEGEPAAINCGAVHHVSIGGVRRRLMTAIHTRILPEHQRKGLWGAVSRVLNEKYDPRSGNGIEGSRGYISVDNASMQKGFRYNPDKWSVQALRAQLHCETLAGPAAGRPATAEDAQRTVDLLNACHGAEEMYDPYTVDSLAARLERAPKQYSWERVWIANEAVVGVWPAGESIRVIIESPGQRIESRRGLVLDYGFLPGAEAEFEGLLRAWCTWLADRGLDTLSIFTSELSPGYELLRSLASEMEAFDVWTPGIPPPPDASERGLYVDQVYF